MKKLAIFLILATGMGGCNDEEENKIENKLDSLENKLESLGEKIDTTAEKLWDTTKAKAKDLKEEWKERRDSNKN